VYVPGPVSGFGEFAIADYIDPGLGLLPHDFGNGFGETLLVRGSVVRLAVLDLLQMLQKPRRADQAADVGGQNSVYGHRHLSVKNVGAAGQEGLRFGVE
jgi:hypothetical protein